LSGIRYSAARATTSARLRGLGSSREANGLRLTKRHPGNHAGIERKGKQVHGGAGKHELPIERRSARKDGRVRNLPALVPSETRRDITSNHGEAEFRRGKNTRNRGKGREGSEE